LKPVFDALAWVWNNVIKPIADVIGAIVGAVTGFLGGGGTPSNQNPNVGGHLQHGGIVTRPTLTWVGEAGPEAVIPLSKGGLGNNITIHGPLITVQGTLDNRTADYAIAKMTDMLKNVLVEPSSVSGSSTHKRIRFGS
jgi:phage-related minor tail protein